MRLVPRDRRNTKGGGLMATRVLHISVTKDYLIDLVRAHGARSVLTNWPGSDERAIEAIQADKRSCFILDPDCDDQGEDGACRGHKDEDASSNPTPTTT